MALTLDLPLAVEASIKEEAERAGITAEELVAQVVEKRFSRAFDIEEQKLLNAPSIALLESWLSEASKPHTPEEIAAAEADLNEFMRNMNATRRGAGERLLYPDVEPK